LWQQKVGIGFSSVAVSEGRVITMGNTANVDTVTALDSLTGRILWQHSYPCELDPLYYEGGPGATPAIVDGQVFTFSKKGHVHCLDAETGKSVWSVDIREKLGLALPEWSFAGSPLVQDGLVILNAGGAGTALDQRSGSIVWSSGPDAGGYATPLPFTAGEQKAVAIFSAKALVAVDPKNGRELWRFPWESSRDVNAADPIIHQDRLFLSTSSGSVMLNFTAQDVSVLWEKKRFYLNYFNPSVLIEGHLYGLDGTTHRATHLTCIDWDTGDLKWKEPGFGSGGWIAADGKLLILDKGELIVVKAQADGYMQLARAQLLGGKCWTAPVLAHGLVYCRNAEGDLVCVDLRTE
jgi:outer membrane protein assembly factor BamB